MKVYMLHERHLGPVPDAIRELQCFDAHMTIIVTEKDKKKEIVDHIDGRSVYLEGPRDAFIEWLKPFDGFWKGVGSPMMEQFEVVHIRDNV